MQPQHTAIMVEPDEAASSSSASTVHSRPYRPPSGATSGLSSRLVRIFSYKVL